MTVSQTQLSTWQTQLAGQKPEAILQWATETFGARVAFASSLGVEDQLLTALIAAQKPAMRIFTLDTGRLFPETYELIQRTEERYGIRIEVLFPDHEAVETMVREEGVNLFYHSIENRKRCCGIRKIVPLRRALSGLDAWVTGLRRDQSVTRTEIHPVEWDAGNGLIKINPLCDWSEDAVWDVVRSQDIPYNSLHDAGFPSIGCASCTRAVKPGEDSRAGRWWWEQPEQKECGLHMVDGKLVRRPRD